MSGDVPSWGSFDHDLLAEPTSAESSPSSAQATSWAAAPRNADDDIEGLLYRYWLDKDLTYSFPTSADQYGTSYGSNEPQSFSAFTATQALYTRRAIDNFDAVSGLSFTEVSESGNDGDTRFGMSSQGAHAVFPESGARGGDVWMGNGDFDYRIGGNGYDTVLHEFGHAMGLKHGHEDFAPYGTMTYEHNAKDWSVMTYRAYVGDTFNDAPGTWSYAQSLMMYDIAALQFLYGADYGDKSNNKDTVYRFSSTTGEMFVRNAWANESWIAEVGQGTPGENKLYRTVWDGGGRDTYNFSGYDTNLKVDLRPGNATKTSDAQLAHLNAVNPQAGAGAIYASGNLFNALLFNGDTRSLIEDAIGGSGNDDIVGNQAANNLKGGGGNDTIVGWDGNDTINGENGNDHLNGYGDHDIINGDAGNDTVIGSGGNDTLYGGGFGADENDDLRGEIGDDLLVGSGGNDTLDGGEGVDRLHGGAGDDIYYMRAGDSFASNAESGQGQDAEINGTGGGIDLVVSHFSSYTLLSNFENLTLDNGSGSAVTTGSGNSENNNIAGNQWNNSLSGQGGNDTIVGWDGNDTINGGDGNDNLNGYAHDDFVNGDGGNDTIYGSSGNDTLFGGGWDDDQLYGETGSDLLDAGGGNDTLDGGDAGASDGADSLIGGGGDDTYHLRASDVLGSNTQAAEVTGGGIDTIVSYFSNYTLLAEFENLTIGASAPVNSGSLFSTGTGHGGANLMQGNGDRNNLTGLGGNDTLRGYGGNDVLNGNDGDDTLEGGDDNDLLYGGSGSNHLVGGSGNDEYWIETTANSFSEAAGSLGGSADIVFLQGAIGSFSLDGTNIEHLTVDFQFNSAASHTLTGSSAANVIKAGGKASTIRGLAGNDSLEGSGSGDTFYGGDDNDTINGSHGTDALYGEAGNDRLDGGNEADTLDGGAGLDVILGGAGNDLIRMAENDRTAGESIDGGLDFDRLEARGQRLDLTGITVTNIETIGTSNTTGTTFTVDTIAKAMLISGGTGTDALVATSLNLGETLRGQLFGRSIETIVDSTGTYGQTPPPTNTPPNITSDGGSATAALQVQENATFVTDVNATDPDAGASLTYSIVASGDGALFQINSLTGQLSFRAAPDFENPVDSDLNNIYGVTVRVEDGQGGADEQALTVTVGDENEGTNPGNTAPTITSGGGALFVSLSAQENQRFIGTFAASDPDTGAVLTYSIVPSAESSFFQIETLAGGVGALSFTFDPDFENPVGTNGDNLHGVAVRVEDGQGGFDEQTLFITITDQNYFPGSTGHDLILGDNGADTMEGGFGNDTYAVNHLGDVVSEAANQGMDLVESSVTFTLGNEVENLTLVAWANANGFGNELANTLRGNGAANLLRGGVGLDTLDGGASVDTADYRDKRVAVSVTLNGATDALVKVGGTDEDTIRNIENVLGGSEGDTLTGDDRANQLSGYSGNDSLTGGLANDLLSGGAGADTLDGGTGVDVADYREKTDGVAVVLRGDESTVVRVGTASEDSVRNIESVYAGSGNDSLTGDAQANTLAGYLGNDILKGGEGADNLDGGGGVDTGDYRDKAVAVAVTLNEASAVRVRVGTAFEDVLRNVENLLGGSASDSLTGDGLANTFQGYAGSDILNGGGGNDLLFGGEGSDRLTGGTGRDSFVFNAALSATTNVDTIFDFSHADDTIRLSKSVFGALASQPSNAFLGAGLVADWSVPGDGNDHVLFRYYDSSDADSLKDTIALYYDANGGDHRDAVMFAKLTGQASMTLGADDFYLVA